MMAGNHWQRYNNGRLLHGILFCLYLVFLASLIFSLRAFSSIATALLLVVGAIDFLKHRTENSEPFVMRLLFCAAAYVLLHLTALLYTGNMEEGWKKLQMASGIIALPMALYFSSRFLNQSRYRQLMWGFTLLLVAASVVCLVIAVSKAKTLDDTAFFYHQLVQPIGQHAVRFSILVYIALLFLWNEAVGRDRNRKRLGITLFLFLSFFLFLLSSKLVLVFFICSFLLLALRRTRFTKLFPLLLILMVAGVAVVSLTKNPVEQRFRLLFSGDAGLFQRNQFDQGIYFNGVQFRLLQWRLVPKLLQESSGWLQGIGPGDAQDLLNKNYVEMNMYTGVPGTSDKGLLDYHTHNQFLQSFLELGVVGLLVFLLLFYCLAMLAVRERRLEAILLLVLLFLYCFTDAILQTQYGIVIFCFFPLLSYLSHRFNRLPPAETPATL